MNTPQEQNLEMLLDSFAIRLSLAFAERLDDDGVNRFVQALSSINEKTTSFASRADLSSDELMRFFEEHMMADMSNALSGITDAENLILNAWKEHLAELGIKTE